MDIIKIGFIGAGKVGMGLGAYFGSKGHRIIGYYSRSMQSAQNAADKTKSTAFEEMGKLVEQCDMLFITTPDGQIINAWNALLQYNIKNKIICHVSGSLSSALFETTKEHGAYAYSIHPMYAFSGNSIDGLDHAYFTIEGNIARLQEVNEFITAMGNETLMIDTDKKVLYHIANVMVSNLVLALLSMGENCLQQCNVSAQDSMKALMPLINGNIRNISKKGIIASLTGPIERGDTMTIKKHLEILPEEYGTIYAKLSMILLQLAEKRQLFDRDYFKIYEQLQEYLKNLIEKEPCQ